MDGQYINGELNTSSRMATLDNTSNVQVSRPLGVSEVQGLATAFESNLRQEHDSAYSQADNTATCITPGKSCTVCDDCPSDVTDFNEYAIWAHNTVRQTGMPNFMGARIPVISSWNVEYMEAMLSDYHDKQVTMFLKYGWPINIDRDRCHYSMSLPANHRGARENKAQVITYLHKEMSYKSIVGPFVNNPFMSEICVSPLNTRDKKDSQDKRVITDLSFPPTQGVNDCINMEWYFGVPMDLKYPTLETILQKVRSKGKGCLLYKRDIKRCYRQIPVCWGDISHLGYSIDRHMFFDLCLPMGLSSSAYICQRITSSIAYIANNQGTDVCNYLDDHMGVSLVETAHRDFITLGQVIHDCGAEENEVKACPPETAMECVGVLVDTVEMSTYVTPDKVKTTTVLLQSWLKQTEATKRDLQCLIGTLNFLVPCIPFSRVFMNRLLQQLRGLKRNQVFSITAETQAEVKWWITALSAFNGKSFCPLQEWSEPDEVVACDASLIGGGG